MNLAALASVYQGHRRAEAQRLFVSALEIQEEIFGPSHPEVALTLNNLALLLRESGRPTEARRHLRRALTIFRRRLGPRHPHTRTCAGSFR